MAENGELLPVYEVTEDGQMQHLAVLKVAEGHADFIDRANPTARNDQSRCFTPTLGLQDYQSQHKVMRVTLPSIASVRIGL